VSTFGALLKREGLAAPRKHRRKTPLYTQPLQHARQANDLWCADFKGWFLTRDQDRIDPLTVSDATSRYLLRCQAVEKTNTKYVLAIFESAFREFGLPWAIRTDNGPPFASRAIAGLSPLALYWMKLGIVVERIQPGHPEQNGRHERMHRTLKAETASPPAPDRTAQQQVSVRASAGWSGRCSADRLWFAFCGAGTGCEFGKVLDGSVGEPWQYRA
jgi:transposase InsO family protein